uniref:Uncharacterized protein n=1 Tax=viral metagenome TaxID=1070528 RepID=A0A6M3IYN3_9ZZZZ
MQDPDTDKAEIWHDLFLVWGNQGKAEDSFDETVANSPDLSFRLVEIVADVESTKIVMTSKGGAISSECLQV